MTAIRCLGCGLEAVLEEISTDRTMSPAIVRAFCVMQQKRTLWRVQAEADIQAEALRIFGDDLVAIGGLAEPGVGMVEQRELVVIPPPAPPGRLEAGLAASAAASRRWTEAELGELRTAILAAAHDLEELTTDDVYNRLRYNFPVTKGIAARMQAAARAGVLEATDRIAISQRVGEHGHGQRLTIWRSLVYRRTED